MHLKELDANLLVVLDALLIDASVSRAAERLGRSPSAVSHALANLRQLFDDELFVRAGQRLVATARARQLAPAVHVIVAGMESLLRPAAPFDPASQERAFTLACGESLELTLLPRMRMELAHSAPGISLSCLRPAAQAHEDLRQGRVHFRIGGAMEEDAADLCWQPLFTDRLATFAAPGHALCGAAPSVEQFAAAGHVVVESLEGAGGGIESRLAELGHAPKVIARTGSVFAGVFLALEEGALVSIPDSVAKAVSSRVPLGGVRQPFAAIEYPVGLGWHRSLDRDECHEWLRQRFVEAAGKAD
jgi:DNA-binding transcriptional LysR family regulator